MNKKELKQLGEFISGVVDKKLADAGVTGVKSTPKENKQTLPKSKEAHSKGEILSLLSKMPTDESKSRFGILKSNKPYAVSMGITRFFEDYNIALGEKDKPRFTYEHKHAIFMNQLKGETKSTRSKVKSKCVKFLKEKLDNPPTVNRWGKPIPPRGLENYTATLTSELNRWTGFKP